MKTRLRPRWPAGAAVALCAVVMLVTVSARLSAADNIPWWAGYGPSVNPKLFLAPPSQAGGGPVGTIGGGFTHGGGRALGPKASLSATPEPGTLLLMITGAAALFRYRNRSQQ